MGRRKANWRGFTNSKDKTRMPTARPQACLHPSPPATSQMTAQTLSPNRGAPLLLSFPSWTVLTGKGKRCAVGLSTKGVLVRWWLTHVSSSRAAAPRSRRSWFPCRTRTFPFPPFTPRLSCYLRPWKRTGDGSWAPPWGVNGTLQVVSSGRLHPKTIPY